MFPISDRAGRNIVAQHLFLHQSPEMFLQSCRLILSGVLKKMFYIS